MLTKAVLIKMHFIFKVEPSAAKVCTHLFWTISTVCQHPPATLVSRTLRDSGNKAFMSASAALSGGTGECKQHSTARWGACGRFPAGERVQDLSEQAARQLVLCFACSLVMALLCRLWRESR